MARRVVITGATRGLGAAMACHHLEAGDDVIGCGRTEPSIEHPRYQHCHVDVTEPGDIELLFDDVRDRFGKLDVLINNAGIACMNAIVLTPAETARMVMETNLLGTFLCTRAAARVMRGAPHPRIVNLTSVAVPLRLDGEAIYAASKSAVETFTRIAARELGPFGITCNAIGPSPVRTALVAGVPQDTIEGLVQSQAVRRWAEPLDVINAIEFFLRPESGLVTGQVLYLGGAG